MFASEFPKREEIDQFSTTPDSPDEVSDADLVIAAQKGDELAMKRLLKRHERTVANMIYRMAPDFKDSSDIVQETLIRIWAGIPHLKNPYSFKTWLNRIVTNLFYDELRKRPRNIQLVSIDEPVVHDNNDHTTREIVDDTRKPEEMALNKELWELISDALSSIPQQFRTVVVLRDLNGLSYDEIAEMTRSDLGTVKSRIARGRAKIQRRLNSYLGECA